MQSDNFTQELKDAGLRSPSELKKVWDVNLAVGGPIKRDRLWFFATTRTQGSYVSISDAYFNKNAGDPNAWTYVPDLTHQSETDGVWKNTSLRTTWQISTRNKLALFWDEQTECRTCKGGGSPTVSPEAAAPTDVPWMRAYQAVWTAPLSNKFLLEAAFSGMGFSYGREKDGNNRNLIQVMDQVGPITYRSMNWRPAVSFTPRYRASLSYVSGAHNMKVGFDQMDNISDRIYHTNFQGLAYRFNGGVPNRLTMVLNDFRQKEHVRGGAAYAQDQWTVGRLTAQGGVRYDWGSASAPEQTVGPDLWIPTPDRIPRPGSGARLSRHQPARRAGVRRVRQREDVAEAERRPLRGHGPVGGYLRRYQPDLRQRGRGGSAVNEPVVDRCQPQLRARLQPAESGAAGSPRRAAEISAERRTTCVSARPRRRPTPMTRHCWAAGASGLATCSSGRRFSRKCSRGSRWRSVTPSAGSRRSA